MSETTPISLSDLPSAPPEPEPPINIDDLLNDIEVVRQKEVADKATLESISGISSDALRQRLVTWATQGFANTWTVMEISVVPPAQCSDGVARSLEDYILFVSGKTLAEHVAVLQVRLTGIVAAFAWTGRNIRIVVSKA